MAKPKLRLKRPGKKPRKVRNQLRKSKLKTYDENVIDETGPFEDDSAEVIDGGLLPTQSKHLELKGAVPKFKVGSKNDPFKGKPRVFLFEREFAIVWEDKYNLGVYHYTSQFDGRKQDVVTKYRRVGYSATLPNAVRSVRHCFIQAGMTICQSKDIKDLLKWFDKQDKKLTEELKKFNSLPSSSGQKPS